MLEVIKNLKQGMPASYSLQLNAMEWRDKQKNFAAKHVVTELAFVGTTITSTLEGIGALIASVVVTTLNYVVPQKYDFNTKVVQPVLNYRYHTRMALSNSLVALVNNVTTEKPIHDKTIKTVQEFYLKLGIAALRVEAGALRIIASAFGSYPKDIYFARYEKLIEVGSKQLNSGKTYTDAWSAAMSAALDIV